LTGNTLGKDVPTPSIPFNNLIIYLCLSGNGDDYKRILNSEKTWEIDAYPKLLAEIRNALGPKKLISAAVPGLQRDMIAFTEANLRQLNESLDFLNIMTYDLMNRRDNVTRHHTGLQLSLEGLKAYLNHGIAPWKANLGFAFYVKWFKTKSDDGDRCLNQEGIGCKTMLLEDPVTGADLGQSGSFSWHDPVPPELAASFRRALMQGSYDSHGGGHSFWDEEEFIFWTWDTPDAIHRKFPLLVDELRLGGVFAWGLGEDAPDFKHLRALTAALRGGSGSVHSSTIRNEQSIAPVQRKEEL
jgi:GH18 family chitinase